MEIGIHVVTTDNGLAPNPFHGICTQALCTPSHSNSRLKVGDWLLGVSSISQGSRSLVYLVKISEVLYMAEYANDQRYSRKKPSTEKIPYENYCGDNIYEVKHGGSIHFDGWKRRESCFHKDMRSKDVGKSKGSDNVKYEGKGSKVFIANMFWYFGCNRIKSWDPLQSKVEMLIKSGARGMRYMEEEQISNIIDDTLINICKQLNLECDNKSDIYNSSGMHGWPKDAVQICPLNRQQKASFSCHNDSRQPCNPSSSGGGLYESCTC